MPASWGYISIHVRRDIYLALCNGERKARPQALSRACLGGGCEKKRSVKSDGESRPLSFQSVQKNPDRPAEN